MREGEDKEADREENEDLDPALPFVVDRDQHGHRRDQLLSAFGVSWRQTFQGPGKGAFGLEGL